ncbi:MAG: helix-turn-helix transcriptional regulator [Alphaproteobacteria bacterium]|nr:helix-turn-helix transcriptional regulator [Alphaproteobacteria bacterium]
MDIKILVGINLRRMRLERGFAQEDLAYEAGIAPSFLSQIETGKRAPTVTTLDVLAKAMKMPIVEFFASPAAPKKGLPRGRRTR